jgi:hypothetical protein
MALSRKPLAVESYIAIVLGERLAEEMASFGIGDEIEIIGSVRAERGFQRCGTRVGNGTRGKSDMAIGVVRRIKGQASCSQASIVVSSQFECVNDGWIALQGHAPVEAIDENARDQGPFFWFGSFAFDERSERHDLPERQA